MRKSKYLYLKEVNSLALANVQLQLQETIKNGFDGKTYFSFKKYSLLDIICKVSYTKNVK